MCGSDLSQSSKNPVVIFDRAVSKMKVMSETCGLVSEDMTVKPDRG